jgi:hypothetical protein
MLIPGNDLVITLHDGRAESGNDFGIEALWFRLKLSREFQLKSTWTRLQLPGNARRPILPTHTPSAMMERIL